MVIEKKIYLFWTGTNDISYNRINSIIQLKTVSGCEIVLVTPNNLHDYILPNEPLHPAYEYLCLTHKADYLRTYFMNFYGGGYSDIKQTMGDWSASFDELNEDEEKWVVGYPEVEWALRDTKYADLREYIIGNCAYICKPDTPFTHKWYNTMMKLMDEKLEALRLSPATNPQDSYEASGGRYPLRWQEMLSDIFHVQVFQYHKHIIYTLPSPVLNVAYR